MRVAPLTAALGAVFEGAVGREGVEALGAAAGGDPGVADGVGGAGEAGRATAQEREEREPNRGTDGETEGKVEKTGAELRRGKRPSIEVAAYD